MSGYEDAFVIALEELGSKPSLRKPLASYIEENEGPVRTAFDRTGEDEPPLRRLLCSILMSDGGRLRLEQIVSREVRLSDGDFPTEVEEIVVGGGIHAAIWCANREGPRPLVLERRKPGGPYATARPVFYLNSRNRMDDAQLEALPGEQGAINRLPGALIQPMDLSFREYQPQTDLAFAAALNLILYADVRRYANVLSIESQGSRYVVEVDLGSEDGPYTVAASRVVLATGPGDPRQDINATWGARVMTFPFFVNRMGNNSDTPIRGWNRVCVIGGGDSAAVTCEYLLGQGPDQPLMNAQRDSVAKVDWLGCKCGGYGEYLKKSRSRYAGLARYMPRGGAYNARLFPRKDARVLSAVYEEGEGVKVRYLANDEVFTEMYDHVVDCTGFVNNATDLLPSNPPIREVIIDGEPVAKKVLDDEVYLIGPCADLPVLDRERARSAALANIPENSAALFRYAGKTAKLAQSLNQKSAEQRAGEYVAYGTLKNPVGTTVGDFDGPF